MGKKKGINKEIKIKLDAAIGMKVQKIRNGMGLSQKELAMGIGVYQVAISRIEANNGANIYILKKIADFADVDVDYFLQGDDDLEEEQKEEYKGWIRTLVSGHQFKEAEPLVNTPPHNFTEPKDMQFLFWHQGILQSGLYNNQPKARQLFDQAIHETSGSYRTERQAEILISKGVSFLDSGDPDQAIFQFEKVENGLRFLKIPYNSEIMVRNAYNRAAAYYDMGEHIKSILECEKALLLNKRHNSNYLAGELNYQFGLSHFFAGNVEQANLRISGSIFLFQSAEKEKWAQHAINKLIELGLK